LITKTILSEKEEKEFTEFLHQKIRSFNNEKSPYHKSSRKPGSLNPLNLILKNASGEIIGGLAANTYWDWMDIEDLYSGNITGRGC